MMVTDVMETKEATKTNNHFDNDNIRIGGSTLSHVHSSSLVSRNYINNYDDYTEMYTEL